MGLLDRLRSLLGYESEQDGPYYVYELIDARFEKPIVFYVGSGDGDRMYQHEKDARALLKRTGKTPGTAMKLSCKHKRMIEIWDSGGEVGYSIPFRSNSRCKAYQVEAEYIRNFGLERLSNETFGWSDAAVKKCFAAEARATENIAVQTRKR